MALISRAAQDEALAFAHKVADTAAGILNPHPNGAYARWKSDGTPVSAYDLEIEQMVVTAVNDKRSGERVLGEEGVAGGSMSAGGIVWVVDPIDGTELFIDGQKGYVFSIALVVDGIPEVALVREPHTGVTWSAAAGRGAWRDWKPIFASRTLGLGRGAKFSVPRMPANDRHLWPEVVSTVDGYIVETLRTGSVIRNAMAVAEGELDGLIFGRTGPWDMAAAALIVPEAGGRVTNLHGKDQRYDMDINGAVVSNTFLHEDLLRLVEKHAGGERR